MFEAPRRWLIQRVVLCVSVVASAQCFALATPPELFGVWEAGARAYQAIYGRLKISTRVIQFSPNGGRWKCPTPYEVVEVGDADSYPDAQRPFPPSVPSWRYVKVRLGKSKCPVAANFVFAFWDDTPDYLGFVEFRNNSQWSGTGHFHRAGTYK
jgi:hypothetical protein